MAFTPEDMNLRCIKSIHKVKDGWLGISYVGTLSELIPSSPPDAESGH